MITEGYLVRHYQGRRGGRGPAIIDIAQDHLLYHLANEGVFELGVSLKGGTAIRKLRAGNAGRFSTDLDFAGMDDTAADLLVEVVDGATVGPFEFSLEALDGTRCMRLAITSPFGETGVPARLDLGRRALWLPRAEAEFIPEAIGYLTAPVDTAGWVRVVRERFGFLRDLDDVETRLLCCSLADEWGVRQMIEALGREE